MITAVALAVALAAQDDCSRPPREPQAGHGLFTHIRRFDAVCLPPPASFTEEAMTPLEPVGYIPAEPLPFVPALPTEGLWALPYGGPYCECVAEGSSEGYGGFGGGGWYGGGGGGFYAPPGHPDVPVPPTAPVPEPGIWSIMIAGLIVLYKRNRHARLDSSPSG